MPVFQPRNDMMDEDDSTPDTFVAPRAPAPGTPSPEALQRLQAAAAAQRPAADQQAPQRTPDLNERVAAAAERKGFGINSLINRMTGHAGDTPQQPERNIKPVRQQ